MAASSVRAVFGISIDGQMQVINWAWSDPPTEFTQCASLLQTVFEQLNKLIAIMGWVTAPTR